MGRSRTKRLRGLSLLGPLLMLLTWTATLTEAQSQEGSAIGPTHLSSSHLSPSPEHLSTVESELRAAVDPTPEDLGNSTQATTGNYTGGRNIPVQQAHLAPASMSSQRDRESRMWALSLESLHLLTLVIGNA